MSNLYKKIGTVLGVLLMMSCSEDMLKEDPSFIPVNPNPGAPGLPPNDQWAWVGKYPGEISNSVIRLSNVEVKLKGNYQPKDLKIVGTPKYWQSTGLYVPPAEEVTVKLSGNAGVLHYQVGIADVVLPAGDKYERFDKVSKSGVLQVGENRLYNNFGGPLYFYFEGDPSDVTLTVSGAAKMLDYVAGETNMQEWLTAVNDPAQPMIWGELVGKRIIMTLPLATLKKIDQPEAFLKFYDEMIDKDFNSVAGLKDEDIQVPWRLYSDVQLPKKALMYPSYPMGFNSITADSMANAVVGMQELTHKASKTVLNGFAGLFGMTWNGGPRLKNAIQETMGYHLFQRRGKWSDLGLTTTAKPKEPADRYWMSREADYQAMVLQLLQRYGWGLYSYCSKRCREEMPAAVPEQYKHDLYAMYASEYANVDLTDFFAAWNLPLSMYAQQYMKHYPAPTEKFWLTVDINKQPPFTTETPAGVAYEKMIPVKDTVYSRTYWNMDASSASSPASGMIDGNTTTFWHAEWASGKNLYPHWISAAFRDETATAQEEEFNYLYFVQREKGSNNNPGSKTFVVYIKPTPDMEVEDWILAEEGKEFYLTRDNIEANNNYQYIYLSQSYKAYGIKILLTSSLPRTEGKTDVVAYSTIAEFGTGLLK